MSMYTEQFQQRKANKFTMVLRIWDDTKADVTEMLENGMITKERAQEILSEVAETLNL